jgi:NAD+ diphosphatase
VSLLSETLPNLSLARPGLPRAADRRLEPGLVADLLADPATRVVELRGDRVEVEVG